MSSPLAQWLPHPPANLGQLSGTGPGRLPEAVKMALGRTRDSLAGREDLTTTIFCLHPQLPSSWSLFWGFLCTPDSGFSLSAQWDQPHWRLFSISVPGRTFAASASATLDWKRQEFAAAAPQCLPPLVLACSGQRCSHTRHPQGPFPRSTPGLAVVEVNSRSDWTKPGSRLSLSPLLVR